MYKNPLIIGVDQNAIQTTLGNDELSLKMLGNNTGNMLFSESLYRNIAGGRRSTVNFDLKEVKDADVIVLAAANWLNANSDWGWLADKISKTGLPLVIVGIGAQSHENFRLPVVKPGTLRLVRLASETSTLISTRGWFTSEVLQHYGILNSLVTGCPSLLLCGPQVAKLKKPSQVNASEVVIHGTRHLLNGASELQKYLYRQAMSRSMDLLVQSELADILVARHGICDSDKGRRIAKLLSEFYGKDIESVREFLQSQLKVFYSLSEWLVYLKSKDFSIGTRLHGTVAALVAGVPAVLITHDSRTIEAGEALNIPMINIAELDPEHEINLQEIYDRMDFQKYELGYQRYRRNFISFLRLNGLTPSDKL